jgi:hypothetical protein
MTSRVQVDKVDGSDAPGSEASAYVPFWRASATLPVAQSVVAF